MMRYDWKERVDQVSIVIVSSINPKENLEAAAKTIWVRYCSSCLSCRARSLCHERGVSIGGTTTVVHELTVTRSFIV